MRSSSSTVRNPTQAVGKLNSCGFGPIAIDLSILSFSLQAKWCVIHNPSPNPNPTIRVCIVYAHEEEITKLELRNGDRNNVR